MLRWPRDQPYRVIAAAASLLSMKTLSIGSGPSDLCWLSRRASRKRLYGARTINSGHAMEEVPHYAICAALEQPVSARSSPSGGHRVSKIRTS